jgi:hypothetical protein
VLHHGFVHGVEMMKKGPESAAVRWFSKMVPKIERWAPSTREVRQDRGGNLESWPMVLLTACVYHAQTRERGLAAVYLRQANDYRRVKFKRLGKEVAAAFRECEKRLGRVDPWNRGNYVTGRGVGSIVPMMALMGIFHLDRWG